MDPLLAHRRHYYILGHDLHGLRIDYGSGVPPVAVVGPRTLRVAYSNAINFTAHLERSPHVHEGLRLTLDGISAYPLDFYNVDRLTGVTLELNWTTLSVSRTLDPDGNFLGVCLSMNRSAQTLLALLTLEPCLDHRAAFRLLDSYARTGDNALKPWEKDRFGDIRKHYNDYNHVEVISYPTDDPKTPQVGTWYPSP